MVLWRNGNNRNYRMNPTAAVPSCNRPRIALVCHADDPLNRDGLSRWLNTWADLVGIVTLHETRERQWRRVRREIRRVGILRFLDVLAFRLTARLWQRGADAKWEQACLDRLFARYAPLPETVPIVDTDNPNSAEAETLLRAATPDLVIARCKSLLAERIFTIPRHGTFVMHPGICPQYRNAHGVFWALANDDAEHAGMTLLKIDRGVDTGPVYGYFRCPFDPLTESHTVIQQRTVFDNLPNIESRLREIVAGTATPLDTLGAPSGEWGQPWLTAYLRYLRRERRRSNMIPQGRASSVPPARSERCMHESRLAADVIPFELLDHRTTPRL